MIPDNNIDKARLAYLHWRGAFFDTLDFVKDTDREYAKESRAKDPIVEVPTTKPLPSLHIPGSTTTYARR